MGEEICFVVWRCGRGLGREIVGVTEFDVLRVRGEVVGGFGGVDASERAVSAGFDAGPTNVGVVVVGLGVKVSVNCCCVVVLLVGVDFDEQTRRWLGGFTLFVEIRDCSRVVFSEELVGAVRRMFL